MAAIFDPFAVTPAETLQAENERLRDRVELLELRAEVAELRAEAKRASAYNKVETPVRILDKQGNELEYIREGWTWRAVLAEISYEDRGNGNGIPWSDIGSIVVVGDK